MNYATTTTSSNKILLSYSSTIKKNKSKYNIKNENYYEPQIFTNRYEEKRKEMPNSILNQKSNLLPSPKQAFSVNSLKASIEQSLIFKLKKQGFISNNQSKQGSPQKKKKQQTHKRILSHLQANSYESTKPQTPRNHQLQSKENFNLINLGFNRSMFDYKHIIGKGGFGKVWKVELKRNKKIYAMKQMSKALIISKKSVPSVMNEKVLLASLNYPFLVNMVQSFQDRQTLYLVMDYLPGSDLRYHISRKKRFTEEEAKFIIASIFLGLKYLHENQIIHRDIKPQNIVLDQKGYARITDLGVARKYRQNNACDTSGTPGYMAPEVLCRQNHSYSVDYFALGIIAYEMMLKKRPYFGRNRKQIRDEILSRQVQVKKQQIPDSWSLEAADFINRLIQRKPSQRLGNNSALQILEHPWLRNYPMAKLSAKNLQSPYIPQIEQNNWDESNISSESQQIKQLIQQNEIVLRNNEVQQLFSGYDSFGYREGVNSKIIT